MDSESQHYVIGVLPEGALAALRMRSKADERQMERNCKSCINASRVQNDRGHVDEAPPASSSSPSYKMSYKNYHNLLVRQVQTSHDSIKSNKVQQTEEMKSQNINAHAK